ncbi:TIR domain-containing protein [Flavobacterium psychraquaticum]|uniref:TIR domain-containing protein n=1 Tax=Flavobacterium psychraquaticum TaxID=3103958 RepID=UPI002ACD8CC8|nr:TIR domain-containing protein [Flavobacterium sp. LB-N7T]
MARKVFVSYKYKDELVADLGKKTIGVVNNELALVPRKTRVRDYVDKLQTKIGKDNINLGEKDGESLKDFSEGYIESTLKNKIYQSSTTIVMISKGMKDSSMEEKDQWIPWEISYSLRVVKRGDSKSLMNAVLGVVLPDENNSYDWYYSFNQECNCTTHHTSKLFKILRANMFNIIDKKYKECNGIKIHITSEPSYIKTVKWDTFMQGNNYNDYIEKALEIRDNKGLYKFEINLQ